MSEPRTFLDGRVTLFHDDCRDVLRGMADNSIDSVVCDPPYHLTSIVKRFGAENAKPVKSNLEQPADKNLDGINAGAFRRLSKGFMGKQWDGGDIAFQTELWAEVLRVLKPGGYIMAFSSCRTYHRMACAIEDAGFITHPFFAWAFGSGFPKAHNLSKQLDRMAGAEREVIGNDTKARSTSGKSALPTENGSTVYETWDITAPATDAAREWDGWFYGTQACKPALEPVYFGQKPFERGLNGAQNILKWGTGAINVAACKISHETIPNGTLAQNTHLRRNINGTTGFFDTGEKRNFNIDPAGRWPSNLLLDGSDEVLACFPETESGNLSPKHKQDSAWFGQKTGTIINEYGGDSGSAARFFASFPQEEVQRIFYTSKADKDDRLGSSHPTIKPLSLKQYLVRLITPHGGVCLDHFAGTGTTGEACFREGFRCILIEREAEYIADIERRMSLVMEGPNTRAYASMKARNRPRDDGPLFGGSEEPQTFRNVAAGFEGEERRKREAAE